MQFPYQEGHPEVYQDERMAEVFDERWEMAEITKQSAGPFIPSIGHPRSYGLTLQVPNGTTLYDISCFPV